MPLIHTNTLHGCVCQTYFMYNVKRHPKPLHSDLKITSTNSHLPEVAQEPPETRGVIVDNIDPNVTEEDFKMFFENEKTSGGGEIDNMNINKGSRRAVIVFKEREGMFY